MSAKQQSKKTKKEQTKEVAKAAPAAEKTVAVVVESKKGGAAKKTQTKKAPATPAASVAATKSTSTASTASATSTKKTVTKRGGAKKEKEVVAPKENSRTRYFKLLVDGEEAHGRFCGAKPKQAANKAFTSLTKTIGQAGGAIGPHKFSIIECTRGSKHKTYNYIGERVKLNKPMKVKIGNGPNAKEIEYNYNNRIMKDKTVTA